VGLDPTTDVVLALSGGADSVYLLCVLASASERPLRAAVHVDHGLRGPESAEDERFCARICAELGVRFVSRRIQLDPDAASLEARARELRYQALAHEARALGVHTLVTGHHADDALETLLLRWMRGSALGGLAALKSAGALFLDRSLRLVRPLYHLRREEVRSALAALGASWREDASNRDQRFARNALRHGLLPDLAASAGPMALANLRSFARAVERLERSLAEATARLHWRPPPAVAQALATPSSDWAGSVSRGALACLPRAVQRRALWRLVVEGTGRPPSRELLDLIQADLAAGRGGRRSAPAGFELHLRASELVLVPPRAALQAELAPPAAYQSEFEFASAGLPPNGAWPLSVPGELRLADGRVLRSRKLVCASDVRPRGAPARAELDWQQCSGPLGVRTPRSGDRVQLLGSSGSRPLGRALADLGVPRAVRARVLVVVSGERIVWLAGLRPAECAKLRPTTRARLVLELLGPQGGPAEGEAAGAGA
jgi:tRNA(Ile)-lysidine synthase